MLIGKTNTKHQSMFLFP